MMLSEAQETLIREITISVPVGELTENMMEELSTTVQTNKGNVLLRIKIVDPAADVAVNLYSKTAKVGITNEMMHFLENNELRYTLM